MDRTSMPSPDMSPYHWGGDSVAAAIRVVTVARIAVTRPARGAGISPPVGSEKPIAVRERHTGGPRDSYCRVAGGLMCPGDGPDVEKRLFL